ncbi:NHL repeat containing protein [Candidatus Sulfopaludibacter sp. SbA4]|nr:NHL repeat containing protein [Candidatus Sulfopaludibacter sp. SbA4]
MKSLSGIILCAATLLSQAGMPVLLGQAGSFTNGQAARLVIGQATFTSEDSNSSDVFIGGVSGLAYGADTLIVADSNFVGASPVNHRVLIYQGLSAMLPGPTADLIYNRKCPVCVGQATVVLGQPDFTTATENLNATPSALRLPTAVATDGVHVVVADTDHNRVLIWNRIPSVNNQAADVVVGQADMVSITLPPNNTPTAKSMRGPQGVWIQNGKLYVADTQNNRILIYNHIPTTNGVAADVVLGEPDFTTATQPDLTQQTTSASASNMLNPVSVTSDGIHLFVTDLGYNRVLIWNSIPSTNGAPADVEIGQPDFNSSVANNAFTTDTTSTLTPQPEIPVLCTVSNGNDSNSNPTYPTVCNYTLSFPRFALAGGGRLFIADGGNDRVLVYNTIPTQNAPAADLILGELGGTVVQATDAADSMYCPMSMAWDGTNLYVSDPYDRRITVYSLAPTVLPYQAVRNAASLDIIADGTVTIGGTIHSGDIVTISLGTSNTATPAQYSYTVKATDTLNEVVQGLVNAIQASSGGQGDPNVLVTADITTEQVVLTSRVTGDAGNDITLAATVSSGSQVTATASGANLSGGGDAAKIAPGTIVAILAGAGTSLSAQTAAADLTQPTLPTHLGGTSVYFNGIPAPLYSVSPTQVMAQIPWEVNDTTSINAYVRSVMSDGSIMTTTPVAVTIVPANPGVFAQPGDTSNPPAGMVTHASSRAVGIVSVDGSVTANDVVTVTIEDRTYNYTVQSTDTLTSIRDNLVAVISQDPKVSAEGSGEYTRIILKALVEGPDGDNIAYGASASAAATEVMTAFTTALCCANVENSPVTQDNPAVPGEFIYVYATGLGLPVLNDTIAPLVSTGVAYPQGAPITTPNSALSAIVGGSTADVITATLEPGTVGTFKVTLHLNSGLSSDTAATLTVAQDIYVSKTVTVPIQQQ